MRYQAVLAVAGRVSSGTGMDVLNVVMEILFPSQLEIRGERLRQADKQLFSVRKKSLLKERSRVYTHENDLATAAFIHAKSITSSDDGTCRVATNPTSQELSSLWDQALTTEETYKTF